MKPILKSLGILAWLPALLCSQANATAAWYKSLSQLPASRYTPRVALLKLGSFGPKGELKPIPCKAAFGIELHAWVTRRLSTKDSFDKAAGNRLGADLAGINSAGCYTAIELDIEPLVPVPTWLPGFLAGVKEKYGSTPVRLAVPPVSSRSLAGGLSLGESEARELLKFSDGLDFMIYDTGLTDESAYAALIQENIAFSVANLSEGRIFFLGLPAYSDKTKRHLLKVENLKVARQALSNFAWSDEGLNAYCKGQIQVAVYAGWTLKDADRAELKALGDWRRKKCASVLGESPAVVPSTPHPRPLQ